MSLSVPIQIMMDVDNVLSDIWFMSTALKNLNLLSVFHTSSWDNLSSCI